MSEGKRETLNAGSRELGRFSIFCPHGINIAMPCSLCIGKARVLAEQKPAPEPCVALTKDECRLFAGALAQEARDDLHMINGYDGDEFRSQLAKAHQRLTRALELAGKP
jgi:hypothetical protein